MNARMRFLGRRLGQAVVTLWGLTVVVFLMFQALPGNAAAAMFGARTSEADIRRVNHELGLDKPLWTQYWHYLTRLLHGDLGTSVMYNRPAREVIFDALPTTVELAVYAVILTAIVTVVLAMIAAMQRDKPIDHLIRSVPVVGLGLPTFWIGTMLLFVFALKFQLFPAGGVQPGFIGLISSMFLPACALAILFTAILVRSLRSSLLEVLDSDHVLTARSKGAYGIRLVLRHVLPNAAIPTVTLVGLIFAGLLGGALIVESVFALPGIGSLLISGFRAHDFALVQGITMISAVAILLVNIAVDVLYSILDPRVGLS